MDIGIENIGPRGDPLLKTELKCSVALLHDTAVRLGQWRCNMSQSGILEDLKGMLGCMFRKTAQLGNAMYRKTA